MKIIIILVLSCVSSISFGESLLNMSDLKSEKSDDSKLVLQYPHLKKFLFTPPKSNFYIGFGISPVGLAGRKFMPQLSLFQLHYINRSWDIEMFSASIGRYFSSVDFANGATMFTARVSPKFKIIRKLFGSMDLSIGPMAALELVRFGKIDTKIRNTEFNDVVSDQVTKLSQYSFVFGASMSQSFELKGGKKFKITQSYYKQTYDVTRLSDDWAYESFDPSVENPLGDQAVLDEISKSSVFMLEFSYLY